MSQVSAQSRRSEMAVAARWTASTAAVVCLFIITLLALTVRQDVRQAPLNSPQIATMKDQLSQRPNDEELKQSLRERDKTLRAAFFARQQMLRQGAWLLVAAAGSLVLAIKSYSTLTRQAEIPTLNRKDTWREARLARLGVALSGATLLVVCGSLVLLAHPLIPQPETPAATVSLPLPSAEELGRNWIGFRGTNGDGIVAGGIPDSWDATKGTGIAWKSPVALPGNGSPIVFGANLFLSGSDGKTQEVMCYDAGTGTLKWHSIVPRGTQQEPNVMEDTGHAASTPATDGVRVYAIFPTGDVGAFDMDGKRLWSKSIGTPDSQYGYASSLAVYNGKVIVQWDQGNDAAAPKSSLICLDGATGQQVWKTARPVINSWTSPVVANGVVYTSANPFVIAYSASDGKEIWRAKLMDGDMASSPLWHEGVLYVANDRAVAAAIRTDGSGDVTDTHVKWKNGDIPLPDMVSPLTDGKHLLLVQGGGDMNCLNTADGKLIWNHSLSGMIQASPMLGGKMVYLVDHDGVTHVFELADQFSELRTMPLGEEVSASPAVANGRLYIRGKQNLYCVAGK